ncbi:membrane protein [Mycolicibacterium aromaticivorans JS19b1 = JCM 16368]|uniref:Membrane protein n=1 Tax=Mycolicibacterium aromaticivorans JS19b1 = JCM 16368 TaxID=1440774 RepID=A0A064CQ79_9MYCO|nr:ArsA family ATPase [Mycolicibacterium aromaticivorans]KDF01792.1 membrane protein [Mycolicibacterium aromaticivorans JS19b1 = JCM 16368]
MTDRARISFFVGKGGVGKSTLASATAVRAALAGQRVLTVSTDQAHSLGDVLGVVVPPTGAREPVRILTEEDTDDTAGGHLDALALDTLALLADRWRAVAPVLAARFPESDIKDVAPEELSALPGIQEVLGLAEVAALADSGRWDYVVVDCASTADAMRMLTLPAAFAMYVERAWPRHRRLSAAVDGMHAAATVAVVEGISGAVEELSALLTDAERVSAHLVLTAERVVAAEAVRTLGSLVLMGVQVAELIVNQVLVQDDSYEYRNLPDHPAFGWYAERISEQQSVLDELAATIGDVQLVLAPHLAGEPIGPKALGQLLDSVRRRDGSAPPGPLKPVVDRESGSGLDAVYRMRLELPQIDPGTLTLGRVDDDLIIGAAGMRRRVRLASVLRRCIVMDAALRGTELTVRFRPNPEVWPA